MTRPRPDRGDSDPGSHVQPEERLEIVPVDGDGFDYFLSEQDLSAVPASTEGEAELWVTPDAEAIALPLDAPPPVPALSRVVEDAPPPAGSALDDPLDRYVDQTETAIPVASLQSGPRRAERAEETLATSQGAPGIATDGALWLASSSISVADLMESGMPLDWHEAVAIARRICEAVARDPGAGPQEYLLEPRNVEITARGDITVRPGGPGADPLVKQVGRILRALIEAENAPVQLRLLASQAAFEVPGFTSVQELSDALRRFESVEEGDVLRTAFKRGLEAKYSAPPAAALASAPLRAAEAQPGVEPAESKPPGSSIAAPWMPSRPLRPWRVAAVMTGVVAGGLLFSTLWPAPDAATPMSTSAVTPSEPAPTPLAATDVELVPPPAISIAPAAGAPEPDGSRTAAVMTEVRVRREVPERRAPPPAPRTAEAARVTRTPEAPVPASSSPASVLPPPRAVVPPALPDSPVERALALLDVGRVDEAQLVMDAIVLGDPLFEPTPAIATPAFMSALQATRDVLLPALAVKEFVSARASLAAGDYDRALAEAIRAVRMLALHATEESASLRADVQELLTTIRTERARAEQHIYSTADSEVIPPAALGRQLPTDLPEGLPRSLVGTLEIVVSRAGDVETVTLHTPLNRFHERMIVSAAKAWRYRPALRNGRPVRFRLFSTINLPED